MLRLSDVRINPDSININATYRLLKYSSWEKYFKIYTVFHDDSRMYLATIALTPLKEPEKRTLKECSNDFFYVKRGSETAQKIKDFFSSNKIHTKSMEYAYRYTNDNDNDYIGFSVEDFSFFKLSSNGTPNFNREDFFNLFTEICSVNNEHTGVYFVKNTFSLQKSNTIIQKLFGEDCVFAQNGLALKRQNYYSTQYSTALHLPLIPNKVYTTLNSITDNFSFDLSTNCLSKVRSFFDLFNRHIKGLIIEKAKVLPLLEDRIHLPLAILCKILTNKNTAKIFKFFVDSYCSSFQSKITQKTGISLNQKQQFLIEYLQYVFAHIEDDQNFIEYLNEAINNFSDRTFTESVDNDTPQQQQQRPQQKISVLDFINTPQNKTIPISTLAAMQNKLK